MNDSTREKIQSTLDANRVVVFMKGSKNFPQCGFSHKVVAILKEHAVDFRDVNVLTDPEMREGIKEFASWPTIPQLYIDGKFVGGCDIVMDLHESGELDKILGQKS